jgi:hypothetical protein
MRRFVAGAAVVGVFAAALGCQHVAGMNDVYHHPDNTIINSGGGNPYHTTGGTIYPSGYVPPAAAETKPMDEKPMAEKPMGEVKPMSGQAPMPKASDKAK